MFYCDNAVSCGQRMASLIRQYSQMTVKLQELAIKANLGLLWYLQTVAIVRILFSRSEFVDTCFYLPVGCIYIVNLGIIMQI